MPQAHRLPAPSGRHHENQHWNHPEWGLLARPVAMLVLSRFVSQDLAVFLAKPRQKDLLYIRDLMAAGRITPVIDRCYGLAEVSEAMRYQQAKHARGKVVIGLGNTAASLTA